jgi:hypothetical protein
MKIHIVSLQRSGSKSLYNSIHSALNKPLTFSNGDSLGEYLHCWSEYGYKFSFSATKPFDPTACILFRTHPEFGGYVGSNFTPAYHQGVLSWKPTDYKEVLSYADIEHRLKAIHLSRSLVVKTQLASLLEEFDPAQRVCIKNAVLDPSLFNRTIFLVPDDLERWLCSNYLCDHSGVFVQCKSQAEAAAAFKATPVTIPTEYLDLLSSRYRVHKNLACGADGLVIHTSALTSESTRTLLEFTLGIKVHVKDEKEFSAFDYSTMIKNYDGVIHAADQLRRA